jgi:tetratricopeptide (TPR) repeat protein
MALQLGWLLGPKKALQIWKLSQHYGIRFPLGRQQEFATGRRNFLKQSAVVLAGLPFMSRLLTPNGLQDPHAFALQHLQHADLQPGVAEFIANTYLAHAAEFPDPNETVQALQLYLEGRNLLQVQRVDEALAVFQRAVVIQPDSRHALAGLGAALTAKYSQGRDVANLREAIRNYLAASAMGLRFGRLEHTAELSYCFAQLGDRGAK